MCNNNNKECTKAYLIGMGCCHEMLGPINHFYNKWEIDRMLKEIVEGDIDLSDYVRKEDMEALQAHFSDEVDKLQGELEKVPQNEDMKVLEGQIDILQESLKQKVDRWELANYVTNEKLEERLKDIDGGGSAIDAYSKAECDAKFGLLSEQKSLRADVENALGEIAALGYDKADKSELEKVKQSIPTIWSGTRDEYDGIANKDANTIYLIYDN